MLRDIWEKRSWGAGAMLRVIPTACIRLFPGRKQPPCCPQEVPMSITSYSFLGKRGFWSTVIQFRGCSSAIPYHSLLSRLWAFSQHRNGPCNGCKTKQLGFIMLSAGEKETPCPHFSSFPRTLQTHACLSGPFAEENAKTQAGGPPPPPHRPKVSLGSVSVACVRRSQTLFSDRHQFVQCIGFEEHLSFPLRHGKNNMIPKNPGKDRTRKCSPNSQYSASLEGAPCNEGQCCEYKASLENSRAGSFSYNGGCVCTTTIEITSHWKNVPSDPLQKELEDFQPSRIRELGSSIRNRLLCFSGHQFSHL